MHPHANLTAKQARFVAEYLVDGNGAAAAVRAGYRVASAKVAACRLLTKDNVQKSLQARQSADATRLCLERERVVAGLLEAVAQAREQKNPMAMISGWREIGRMMGFYAPERAKVDLTVGQGSLQARFSAMSDQELYAVIEKATREH